MKIEITFEFEFESITKIKCGGWVYLFYLLQMSLQKIDENYLKQSNVIKSNFIVTAKIFSYKKS